MEPALQQRRVTLLQCCHAAAQCAGHPTQHAGQTTAAPFQHPGAGHRGEAQGIQSREQDGPADRQGNRLIQAPDRAWYQQHRQEHGRQHKRGGHHGTGQLRHRIFRGLLGFISALDASGDVFAHHDGVVHHDSRGQNQTEEDQGVQLRSAQAHHHQAAHQGDRHGDPGNHGEAPAPQKQQQHHQHEQHRIPQCREGERQVVAHRVGHIRDHLHLHARRVAGFAFLQQGHHPPADLDGIGAVPLVDANAHGALPLQIDGCTAIAALAQLNPADVPQSQRPAVPQPFHHEVFQVFHAAQSPLGIDGQADQLPLGCG